MSAAAIFTWAAACIVCLASHSGLDYCHAGILAACAIAFTIMIKPERRP